MKICAHSVPAALPGDLQAIINSFDQYFSIAIKGTRQAYPFKKLHCLTLLQKGFLKIAGKEFSGPAPHQFSFAF